MNSITVVGRMVRDPILRHTPSGTKVCGFTLAVARPKRKDREKETDFIDCVAWGHNAEFVSKYFVKAQQVGVHGSLRIRNWTDKEGNKRRNSEIKVATVYFAEARKQSEKQHTSDDESVPSPETQGDDEADDYDAYIQDYDYLYGVTAET